LTGAGDSTERWELLPADADADAGAGAGDTATPLESGDGFTVVIDPDAMAEGDYIVRFIVQSRNGDEAFAAREFLVTHEDVQAGEYQ